MLHTETRYFTGVAPARDATTPLLCHTPAHQAALVVLQTQPFYMAGGAKGYPETEP